ncbi:hypothetical protein K488DRAFT_44104 [Vararia minispora EC-137]|uniref:Uncharacterized protein n=1 Tax=Vararia minispora EC-137 TaxID=1314806 RepID=A0ACB8QTY9_9AGAM|nr:hypothetical protein K488DRAFT_44104 [Vararia minispora EC-137]
MSSTVRNSSKVSVPYNPADQHSYLQQLENRARFLGLSRSPTRVRVSALWASKKPAFTLLAEMSAKHIALNGLPRAVTPADIRRILGSRHVGGHVYQVSLDYRQLLPTNKAYLTIDEQENYSRVFSALQQFPLLGHTITAASTPTPNETPTRMRGIEGRELAQGRGLEITGTGPQGGVVEVGRSVCLMGFPSRTKIDTLRSFLRGYKLVAGSSDITQIRSQSRGQGPARWLIRLESQSEAQRLVRNLHMTYFEPAFHSSRFLVQARVVY